jgi:hypothetical protein
MWRRSRRLRLALPTGAAVLVVVVLGLALENRSNAPRTKKAPEAGSAIVVDDLFVHLDRYLDWDGMLVVHSSSPVTAVAAMKAASPRISMVADSGTEFPQSQWDTPTVAAQLISARRGCIYRERVSPRLCRLQQLRPSHGSGARPNSSGEARTPS